MVKFAELVKCSRVSSRIHQELQKAPETVGLFVACGKSVPVANAISDFGSTS
jgi:hypothetical protein